MYWGSCRVLNARGAWGAMVSLGFRGFREFGSLEFAL